jgi:GT2 family glycosyltransferase
MKVAIILLTYNTLSKVKEKFINLMIKSILNQDYPHLMLIIVDNGSHDKTPIYLSELLNNATLEHYIIKLPKNCGYAGGNNVGALYAVRHGAEFLFFMNDDIILLDRNLVSVLVNRLMEDESLGAVQPLIINRDGSVNCGFRCGLSSIPKMSDDGRGIFFVSGATLLTRTKAFLEVGMFDPDFFLYHDDVDYSWRLWLSGYRIECVKNVRVYHWGSATLGAENPKFYYYMLRNAVWSVAKNSSVSMLIPRLTLLSLESLISFVLHHALIKRDPRLVKADILGLLNGIKGISVGIAKRALVQSNRRVSEKYINRLMDARIDLDLLFPKTLRRAFAKIWRKAYIIISK